MALSWCTMFSPKSISSSGALCVAEFGGLLYPLSQPGVNKLQTTKPLKVDWLLQTHPQQGRGRDQEYRQSESSSER